MWLQLFENGNAYQMEGAIARKMLKTENRTADLKMLLEKSEAGTWQIAGDGKPEPPIVSHVSKPSLYRYGFKNGDYHLVMSDRTEEMQAFSSDGKLLWKAPALAKGINGSDWRHVGADTPPGIYRLGTVYRDIETSNLDPAYGWYTFDMEDLEGQETGVGRAGICLHGGGTGCPDPYADYQPLLATFGCVRMHNADLQEKVLPLYDAGTVFLNVQQ